jgi:RNA polymerase sigma-70 factor (ECF subfamily)
MSDDVPRDLDAFLASIERRALRISQIATRDRDAALDIVQDAMLQLVRRYAQRPPAEWRPLFYRCLQNRVRDWQRRRWVRQRLFLEAVPTTAAVGPDGDEGPIALGVDAIDPDAAEGEATLAREQTMKALEQALRELPARQREVFELRIWEGLDVRQTALAMQCAEGSVKTHLSRALSALRVRLEGVWP